MNSQPHDKLPAHAAGPPHKPGSRRFRRLASGVLIAASAGLALVGTSALFTDSQTNSSDTFATGTVTVGLGATSTTCNVSELAPGDSSAGYGSGSATRTTCTYNVKYTGSLPAYLGVDVNVANGATPMFTGAASGLQLQVAASGGVSVVDGTTYKDQAGADVAVVAGTQVSNILVKSTPAVTNDEVTFTVDYLLPLAAPNSLQASSSSVQLTFHAVQSANQVTSCVAGRQCTSINWG
ncbi:MAG: TasA family protein [Ilumatobacteraceae bacterium]